jgi:GT2 family glycosyltransferase
MPRALDPERPGPPTFSIVIPSYNSVETLEWCLEGIEEQSAERAPEVTVVESGDPGYLEGVARRFPSVSFVVAPERLYSGQSRNVGARYASGEILVFLDSDCRPEPGWLEALLDAHRRGYGVVCGALENGVPGSVVGTAEHLISHANCAPRMPPKTIAGTTASSGNLSIRRDIFESHGGFAGTVRAVDFALTQKLKASATEVLFWPKAVVAHVNNRDAQRFLSEQVQRGYWSGIARIQYGSQGAIASRFPPVSFLAFPVRLLRFLTRSVRYEIVPYGELVRAAPLSVLGLTAWTWGFFLGVRTQRKAPIEPEEYERLTLGWRDYRVFRGAGDGAADAP